MSFNQGSQFTKAINFGPLQIACFTCQLMFAIYSNFSGTSLFESIFLFLFNTIYTSVPVVVYGLSEQTFPQKILLENPELYRLNRGNHEMMWYRMLLWLLVGLWHAGEILTRLKVDQQC